MEMLDIIMESGSRAAEIIQNMLSFSRMDSGATSAMNNLLRLLDKVIEIASGEYDLKKKYDFKNKEIIREYDEKLQEIPCQMGKIQQVILNLLKNGAQAMMEGGKEKPRFTIRTIKEEKYARIEIEDNGP